MAKMTLLDIKGKEIGKVDVSDEIFGSEVHEHLIHESVLNQLANKRQGTHSTKTRAMVTGSGKKPFRQKGTGRARQGTNKSPLMPGGGIAFGPQPRDYSYRLNKKSKRTALISALADKFASEKTWAVELAIDEIKTKAMVEFLNTQSASEKYNLLVLSNNDENKEKLILSSRNIKRTKVLNVDSINVYDLVRYENIYLTKSALKKIEEVYSNAK
ncbi:MAG: 50S ribosomal protein L4 [Candidatus Muiribacteriota bacterium]